MARLLAQNMARNGKISLAQYEMLQLGMLPEDALPRRFGRKEAKMGLSEGDGQKKRAPGTSGPGSPAPPGPSREPQPDWKTSGLTWFTKFMFTRYPTARGW